MVIDPMSVLSYDELDATTRDLAAALIQAGVVKGSRVGLVMPNGVCWVQIAIAVTRIGAVLVPMSTLLKPPELAAQLRTASVQFLISVEEFRGHRYIDDVQREQLPALRKVWLADQLAGLDDADVRHVVDALAATVTTMCSACCCRTAKMVRAQTMRFDNSYARSWCQGTKPPRRRSRGRCTTSIA